MKQSRLTRTVFITIVIYLIVQIAYIFVFYVVMNRYYLKTTATVVDMEYMAKAKQYPIYEYTDKVGNKIATDDRELDNCGGMNFPCRILQPDIGDRVTVYYKPGDTNSAMFMTGNFLSGDVRFAPTIFAMVIGMVTFFVWGLRKAYRHGAFRPTK